MSPGDDQASAYYIHAGDDSPPSDLTDHITFEIISITASDWLEQSDDRPVLFELAVIQSDSEFGRTLMEQLRDTGLIGLGVPPVQKSSDEIELTAFPDQDVTLLLDGQTGPVSIARELAQERDSIDLSVPAIGYFTQFRGKTLAHDSGNRPVIVEWQPRSTNGQVILSLVELTRLAVTGNEQHRRELLDHLVEYITTNIEENKAVHQNTEDDPDTAPITRAQFNNGLLALYVLSNQRETVPVSLETLENALPEEIDFNLSDEEWSTLLSELEEQNIISGSDVDEAALASTISERSLTPYTRRLLNG